MGKEISTQPELNQYEIINHKSNVRLWLHDVVDGIITPGLVTAENLIAGITLGLDQVYSASDHDHDSDYADIAHNHDSTYATLTEAAKHLAYSHAEWIGATTTPIQRTINLSGDVGYSKFIIVIGVDSTDNDHIFLSFWSTSYGVNTVGLRWGETWTPYHFINLSTFYAAPDTTEGILSLYSDHWNYSGLSYRAFVWGW